jgi:CyaY protein
MLNEDDYVELAQRELKALINVLDELESEQLEAELENDIITLEIGDDRTYVINSHRAARQIWMAAERTAWHFDYDLETKKWIAKKNGDELWSTLSKMLSAALGAEGQRVVRPATLGQAS